MNFKLTTQIPLTTKVCLVTGKKCFERYADAVTLLPSDKCQALNYAVVCSSGIDQWDRDTQEGETKSRGSLSGAVERGGLDCSWASVVVIAPPPTPPTATYIRHHFSGLLPTALYAH